MPVRCFDGNCPRLYEDWEDYERHDECGSGGYWVEPEQQGIRDAADIHARHLGYGPAITLLQERLQDAHSPTQSRHILDAIGYLRKQRAHHTVVADGGIPELDVRDEEQADRVVEELLGPEWLSESRFDQHIEITRRYGDPHKVLKELKDILRERDE